MATTVAMSAPKPKRVSNTLKNFWLDIALFLAFVVDYNLHFTGLVIHEWLGVALGIALIYHLLWHWEWIVSTAKRILGRLPWRQRAKQLVDLLIFADMVLLIATGLWISKVIVPQLGIAVQMNSVFRWLHVATAQWSIWLLALHIALSWDWIVNAWTRYVWQPLTARGHNVVETGKEGAA